MAEGEPRNAALWARLGALYRTVDPPRSLDSYRRAVDLEPANADYATGYAAALVQGRRFERGGDFATIIAAPRRTTRRMRIWPPRSTN